MRFLLVGLVSIQHYQLPVSREPSSTDTSAWRQEVEFLREEEVIGQVVVPFCISSPVVPITTPIEGSHYFSFTGEEAN